MYIDETISIKFTGNDPTIYIMGIQKKIIISKNFEIIVF